MEWLEKIFSLLCGQNPEHTWTVGGLALPCCQRCLGIYAGAAVAAIAQLALKPAPTRSWLLAHGLMLVQIVPLSLCSALQTPVLRTLSGLMFGCAITSYLLLAPAKRLTRFDASGPFAVWCYAVVMAATGFLLSIAGSSSTQIAGLLLTVLAVLGLAILGLLILVNLGCLFSRQHGAESLD